MAEIESFSKNGYVVSNAWDTATSAPEYNELKWSEYKPLGSTVLLKARSSSSKYMIGATAWDAITPTSTSPTTLSIGEGRYVQFIVDITYEPYWETELFDMSTYEEYIDAQVILLEYEFPQNGNGYYATAIPSVAPWVDNIEIDWVGEERICALTGYIARRDDFGKVTITIDGKPLISVLSIPVALNNDGIIESNKIEIEPRNTGK